MDRGNHYGQIATASPPRSLPVLFTCETDEPDHETLAVSFGIEPENSRFHELSFPLE
jgi:hypothetical protein